MGKHNGSSSANQATIERIVARVCESIPDAMDGAMLHGMGLSELVNFVPSMGIDIRDIVPDAPAPTIDRTEAKAEADLRRELARRLSLRKYADQSTDELKHQCIERNIKVSDLFPGDPPANAPTPEPSAQPDAPIQKMECRVLKCREMFHPGYEARHLHEVHGITPDQVGTHTRGCIFGTCFKMFPNLHERNAHMDREHPDVTLVRCPHPGCEDERFHNEAFLQTHLERKHHGQLPTIPAKGELSDVTTTPRPTAAPAWVTEVTPVSARPSMIPHTTAALEGTQGAKGPESADDGHAAPLIDWDNLPEDLDNMPAYPKDPSNWELPDDFGFTPAPSVPSPASQKPTGNPNNVIGMTHLEALDYLEPRGWEVTTLRDFDDEPAGLVFGVSWEHGDPIVAIRISKGPKPEETTLRRRIPEFPEIGTRDQPAQENWAFTFDPSVLDDRTTRRMREQIPPQSFVLDEQSDENVAGTLGRRLQPRSPETVEEASTPSSPPAQSATLGERLKWRFKKAWDNNTPPLGS